METSISIIEYKGVVSVIKEVYGIDLSQHAMGALGINISYFMKKYKYSTTKNMIIALKNDKMIFEKFLSCLYCEHISLFREPALWRILKESVLNNIMKKSPIKIWIPEVSKGSDYFSLVIFLQQHNLLKDSKIIISDQSHLNLEKCRLGELDSSILMNSESNYKRIDEHNVINNYIDKYISNSTVKKELLSKTFIYRSSLEAIKLPYKPNLVFFRNKMLYYTHVKEQKTINILHKAMEGGGFLITGIKENIGLFDIDRKFKIYDEEEQIYKRHF